MNDVKIPYYQSIKFLRKWLKPNTVVFFDELMDQYKYWTKNNDDFKKNTGSPFRGVFYRSRAKIAENTNLKKGAQMAAEAILADMGLLTVIHQPDHPNWYKIDFQKLKQLFYEYQKEEAQKKVEKAMILLPPNYDELTAGYQELDEDLSNTWMGGTPETGSEPIQKADGNKNIEVKINNNNKVSNATYVFDSIEQNNSKNHSCKKESITTPAGAWAPSGKGDEVQDIVNEYNGAMGLRQADGDYEAVKDNLQDFRKIRRYLTPSALEYAWSNFSDETAKELKTKRASALDPYGVLQPFVQRKDEIYTYMTYKWDSGLNKVFKLFKPEIDSLLEKDRMHVNIIGELANENDLAADGKWGRKRRIEIYKEIIEPKLLQDEELHDMIIDMEVPTWII